MRHMGVLLGSVAGWRCRVGHHLLVPEPIVKDPLLRLIADGVKRRYGGGRSVLFSARRSLASSQIL